MLWNHWTAPIFCQVNIPPNTRLHHAMRESQLGCQFCERFSCFLFLPNGKSGTYNVATGTTAFRTTKNHTQVVHVAVFMCRYNKLKQIVIAWGVRQMVSSCGNTACPRISIGFFVCYIASNNLFHFEMQIVWMSKKTSSKIVKKKNWENIGL